MFCFYSACALDQDEHSGFILKDPPPPPQLPVDKQIPTTSLIFSGPFEKSFLPLPHPHFLSVPLKTDYN